MDEAQGTLSAFFLSFFLSRAFPGFDRRLGVLLDGWSIMGFHYGTKATADLGILSLSTSIEYRSTGVPAAFRGPNTVLQALGEEFICMDVAFLLSSSIDYNIHTSTLLSERRQYGHSYTDRWTTVLAIHACFWHSLLLSETLFYTAEVELRLQRIIL